MKTYIDIPTIAYRTILLSVVTKDAEGNVVPANEEFEQFLNDMSQRHPYDKTHPHVCG